MSAKQLEKMHSGKGFIAALDQSGGSTPKALALYGIKENAWSNEEEMFDLVHQMRTRIVTNKEFNGDRILGAILFKATMERKIEGIPSAQYLWEKKSVVPFLKIDNGLAEEEGGVRLMKPMPTLDTLLSRGETFGIFGTKERSVINKATEEGIRKVVDQQFEVAMKVIAHHMVPIIEPEVTITIADKKEAEAILKKELIAHAKRLAPEQKVMFKLSLPTVDGFYDELNDLPCCVRVVALSGGYSQKEANEILARNHGMIASFSRALSEGLTAQMSDEEFTEKLGASIKSIYEASIK
ncbi:MAG: fructose bisphosphate aldolase [Bacilli bacterium]|jgi:fructose-bisphosphate aldolase class I|nr:fructose bisphosphate aldolase [Bacilli bacterium]